jgi:hypothetical protein
VCQAEVGERSSTRFKGGVLGKSLLMDGGNGRGGVVNLGEAALTGWRGNVGRAIAKPIAKRTKFDVQQIEAVLGFLLLAYTVYRLGRPLLEAARRT